MALERMGASDSILWRIERDPILRSTVSALTLFDRLPDWDAVHRRFAEATLAIPRFRDVVQEPVFGYGSPTWRPDADFDLDYHLRRVRLEDDRLDALLDFAAHEAMAEFDRARPLWEFTIVDRAGHGAAMLQKFHHATTDGVGGIALATQLLDSERGGAPLSDLVASEPDASYPRRPSRFLPDPNDLMPRLNGLLPDPNDFVPDLRRLPGAARSAARRMISPARAVAGVVDDVRWGTRLVRPVSSPLSPLMRGRGTRLAFGAIDLDLDELRSAAKAVQSRLNDVFIAAVASGLRAYHDLHGIAVPSLRMTLPVNIRTAGDAQGGNRFVPVRFAVPIGADDVGSIAPAVAERVSAWRRGPALQISDALARVLNALPTPALAQVFGSMLRNIDFVATNVPGLPIRSYLGGAELVRQYAFAPPSGAAVNVALLSHVDRCCIGVNMDRSAVADPRALVGCLEQGFAEVLELAPGGRRRNREQPSTSAWTGVAS